MSLETYILCPGQGAQHVGMGKDFYDASPAARAVYDDANRTLGYDLASLCFTGPEDRLNQTDVSQPAIYVTSVACYHAAVEAGKIDAPKVAGYAGLSLGEYTALHLGGAFSFSEGLMLVTVRGRCMQEAAVAVPSGMVSLLGADEAQAYELCRQAAQGQVLVAANFNSPGQVVVSGESAACQRVTKLAEQAGMKAIALRVVGAFHSPLMQSAADRMARELEKVSLHPPRTTVWSNVTARAHGDAASIKSLLVQQIICPVRWEQTMQPLAAQPDAKFIELAPGRALAGMVKKINRRVPLENYASFAALAQGANSESRNSTSEGKSK